jgi:uncharacterized membrane protein
MRITFLSLAACLLFLIPGPGHAQEVHQELQETVPAEVLKILDERTEDIIGTDTEALVQEVRVRILGGARKGEEVEFETDLMRLAVGDSIYVNRLESIDGVEYYTFKDANRRFALVTLGLFFVAALLFFSGLHGLRALGSLALSIVVLFFVLVPLLLSGYSPVLVSVLVAGPILGVTIFLTHGFHTRAKIAFLGTFGAVIATGCVATLWVGLARLTGLSSDEAIYLNFSTHGSLDFGGILLGSIIIGILGILDDVAITQASVVGELRRANATLTKRELYTRALRVGRDHIGSLVNTLSFAYIGASLPLVLLLVKAESGLVLSLNQEMVAVELIRIFVGSIGLILAVPLTTLIAVWWHERYAESGEAENSYGHTHTHS